MELVSARGSDAKVLWPGVGCVVKETRPFAVEVPTERADADARSWPPVGTRDPV